MELTPDHVDILLRLGGAWAAGSVIGLERSHHGRPAGFRTHALVCGASAMLMIVTTHQGQWLPPTLPLESVRTDPTRMAQGIMTGIGFLGAGVIFQEGLTVRGLTTAASIWITAALGILFGIGFYFPAFVVVAATVSTLSVFRWWENLMPTELHVHVWVRFMRDGTPSETRMREMVTRQGFHLARIGYRLLDDGRAFEYRMVVRTTDKRSVEHLVESLRGMEEVREFRVSPVGEF